jgi:sortase A
MPAVTERPFAAVWVTAAFFSLALLIHSLWIPVKAEAAQWLLRRAWQRLLAGDDRTRPWPGADTRPAALLRVPRYGIEQFVLQGNSARNLAFGPVFIDAATGSRDRIINGHRDTHFRFLRRLRKDDRIRIETPSGTEEYAVRDLEVIDSRQREMVLEPTVRRLSLVTCFPFDAPRAGGPLRYVVTALPVDVQASSARRQLP